jgi:hypothetical protein
MSDGGGAAKANLPCHAVTVDLDGGGDRWLRLRDNVW